MRVTRARAPAGYFGRALRCLLETKAQDEAAYHFATEFYKVLWQSGGDDYRQAFEDARLYVTEFTREGIESGIPGCAVPKFEFRQPGTPAHRGCQPVPIAAGIPRLLTRHDDRVGWEAAPVSGDGMYRSVAAAKSRRPNASPVRRRPRKQ